MTKKLQIKSTFGNYFWLFYRKFLWRRFTESSFDFGELRINKLALRIRNASFFFCYCCKFWLHSVFLCVKITLIFWIFTSIKRESILLIVFIIITLLIIDLILIDQLFCFQSIVFLEESILLLLFFQQLQPHFLSFFCILLNSSSFSFIIISLISKQILLIFRLFP